MKRLFLVSLVLLVASLACSWSDVVVPTPAFVPDVHLPASPTPILVTVTLAPASPTATAFLPATMTPTAFDIATATGTMTYTPSPTGTATVAPPTGTTTITPPTATATITPPTGTTTIAPPTATATVAPPTGTTTIAPPTATATVAPPTATATVAPPTATATIAPPTATFTAIPLPTLTPTPADSVCVPVYNNGFENEVVYWINEERGKAGLDPLTMQTQLWAAARGHSVDMACNDFISHTGSDGSSPWTRIAAEGYSYSMAAENVAGGQPTPRDVVDAWMASDSHRANIMNPDFVHIGIGYAFRQGSTFGAYWTAVFARP